MFPEIFSSAALRKSIDNFVDYLVTNYADTLEAKSAATASRPSSTA